ncbi:MAG: hypothetical protein KAU14_08755 [Thermoplasmata archaeon]|nr:hypothetical protein [Thermoplasmata archaeon]
MTGEEHDSEGTLEERKKRIKVLIEQMAKERELIGSLKMEKELETPTQNETPAGLSEKDAGFDLEELEPPAPLPPKLELELKETEIEAREMKESQPHAAGSEIEEYRNNIDDFRARGYNVSRLYGIFTSDIGTIRKEVLRYMDDVTKLKDLEKELNEMDTAGYDKEAGYLRTLLKNPDAYSEAESYFNDLKTRIAKQEDEERASRLKEIESLFDDILRKFPDVQDDFQEEIEDIKAAIIDMETAPLSEFFILKKKVWGLRDSLEKKGKEKEGKKKTIAITTDLEKWRERGFDVSGIEAMLETNPEGAEKLYSEFLTNAGKLMTLDKELESLDTAGFEQEIGEIKEIIRDHKRVFDVENKLESIKRRIRLSEIRHRIEMAKGVEKEVPEQRIGPTEMKCPKCGGAVPIPSDQRPLKVRCSSCKTEYNLKRVPVPEGTPPPPGLPPQVAPVFPPRVPSQVAPVLPPPVPPQVAPVPPPPGPPQVAPAPPSSVPPQTLPAPPPSAPPPRAAVSTPPAPPPPLSAPQPTPVPPTPAPEKPREEGETDKCPKCGAALIPGSVFCGICGYHITD